MNLTFVIASLYDCNSISEDLSMYRPDPVWRTTALGCNLLAVLQDMYHFQTTYVRGYDPEDTEYSSPPDIFAKPLPLTPDAGHSAYPLQAVIDRRYGFILRRGFGQMLRPYYRLPFSVYTWQVLSVIVVLTTLILYLLSRWEKRIVGARQEYSFTFELLIVFGATCQHIPPVHPIMLSRRIAYLTFFTFCYLAYTFYTSNLLSHLVNDRDNTMSLEELATGSYQFITLENIPLNATFKTLKRVALVNKFHQPTDLLEKKFIEMKYMNMTAALEAISKEKVALLSDFITVYPYMRADLEDSVICSLTEINMVKNIKEYLFTSKTFPLKEEFKIGLLRIIETGVLKRIKKDNTYSAPECQYLPKLTIACLDLVGSPLIILAVSYFVSFVILMLEREHYKQNRVWPIVN